MKKEYNLNMAAAKSKYQKPFVLFLLNTFLLIIFLLFIEIFAYKSLFVSNLFDFPDYNKFEKIKDEFLIDNHPFINYEQPKPDAPIHFENDGRSFIGKEFSNKTGILLLGDSYTYGLGLKKNETFGYQLSKYMKKTVYTWGWCTEGIEYSLLQLKNKKNIDIVKKENKKSLDYVIYTYTYNQPIRLVLPNRQYRYFWLRKFGLLNSQKYSSFDRLYSVLTLKNKLFINSLKKGNYENNLHSFILREIRAIYNEVLKNFPEAKFVVLLYSDSPEVIKKKNLYINSTEENILNSKRWKELEKDGIIVITTEELLGRKMRSNEIIENERTVTIHPNKKAWEKIVPKLCQRLYGF